MAHQRDNLLKTPPRRQLAKVRPKSPGQSQVSCCRVRAGPLLRRRRVGARGREGGRDLWVQGSEKQNPSPKVPTAAQVRTPAAPRAGGEGPGPLARPLTPQRGVWRCCKRERRARPPSQNPPSVPAGAARLSFPCSGPSRRPWPWPWPRASRRLPVRRQPRAQPPGGGAPVAEPAPAPRGALAPGLTGGAPQAGWRESPRHGRQAPPRAARGRERHPRRPALGGSGASGAGAGSAAGAAAAASAARTRRLPGRRGRARELSTRSPLLGATGAIYCLRLVGRGAAPRPEVCPGSGAASS